MLSCDLFVFIAFSVLKCSSLSISGTNITNLTLSVFDDEVNTTCTSPRVTDSRMSSFSVYCEASTTEFGTGEWVGVQTCEGLTFINYNIHIPLIRVIRII